MFCEVGSEECFPVQNVKTIDFSGFPGKEPLLDSATNSSFLAIMDIKTIALRYSWQ